MRPSWFKWMLIVAALFAASGNRHSFADHAVSQAQPCATHAHHDTDHRDSQNAAEHRECCCSCFDCPATLVTPFEESAARPVAYSLHWVPGRASPLANRSPAPELDPPRPGALS